ncbi:MAG: glutathione peroxidase, partial [Lachnospiraceae bacterium]|nr:glutathione peroxidase [Lachnospiraceae bacterium]
LPLYKYLKDNSPKEIITGLKNTLAMSAVKKISNTCKKENDIVWNFTKFLIDKDGNVVERFEPTHDMKDVRKKVEELLK